MKKKLNQHKIGALLTYAQMLIGVIISIIYTPVMIRTLGQSEYGLYNTVSSTISMLSILNLGFGSGYIRYHTKYSLEGDETSIEKLNGLFLIIFTVIGVIALACGLYISANLNFVFDGRLSASELVLAQRLMVVLAVNLAVSFPMSVFTSIISANEHFVFLKLVGILKTVVSPMLTIPLLLLGYRSVALVVCTLIVSLMADFLYLYYVLHRLKNRFRLGAVEPDLLKGLFTYTAFIAINLVVDQINTNLDKLLLTRFNGTVEAAIYSVGFQLYHYYTMLSTAISSVYTPRVHMLIRSVPKGSLEQKEKLTDLFIKVGRAQFLILTLVASGLLFFGKTFITDIWAGKEYGNAYYVMLLLVLPAMIPLIQNIGIEIQRAQNKHYFRSYAYLIMAIGNCFLTIMLCPRYGAVGAAIGTAISLLLANGLVMNIYYHRVCNIDIRSFWRNIRCISKGLVLPMLFGWALQLFFNTQSLLCWMVQILSYIVVYLISMLHWGMNSEEKHMVDKIVCLLMPKKSER